MVKIYIENGDDEIFALRALDWQKGPSCFYFVAEVQFYKDVGWVYIACVTLRRFVYFQLSSMYSADIWRTFFGCSIINVFLYGQTNVLSLQQSSKLYRPYHHAQWP